MSFYSRAVFPRLCDWILGQPQVSKLRRELLAEAHGNVLEIGFGTGLNLPHYPNNVRRVTAVDPNPGMHKLAQKRIRGRSLDVEHHTLSGERLPFADGSFDCAVSTFTLCSVRQVELALSELYRVLRVGGSFLFLEHGLSPDPAIARWQQRLNPWEIWFADGCHLDREIGALVRSQPFATVQIEQFYGAGFPKTHGYLSKGVAVK